MTLTETTLRAIASLARHGFHDASECLRIQLLFYQRERCTEAELRRTANQLLSILAS